MFELFQHHAFAVSSTYEQSIKLQLTHGALNALVGGGLSNDKSNDKENK